jgi:hypothetical protein
MKFAGPPHGRRRFVGASWARRRAGLRHRAEIAILVAFRRHDRDVVLSANHVHILVLVVASGSGP